MERRSIVERFAATIIRDSCYSSQINLVEIYWTKFDLSDATCQIFS